MRIDLGLDQAVVLRLIKAEDSISELTELLHRSYRRLAELGLRYVATHQDPDITARRIARGECHLALLGERIIATILFEDAETTAGCPWYDRPEVASFHQFAVDPGFQSKGLGRALLSVVEERAASVGARELALDTAEQAEHLIGFYGRLGYRHVGVADWPETNYRSVILSKAL